MWIYAITLSFLLVSLVSFLFSLHHIRKWIEVKQAMRSSSEIGTAHLSHDDLFAFSLNEKGIILSSTNLVQNLGNISVLDRESVEKIRACVAKGGGFLRFPWSKGREIFAYALPKFDCISVTAIVLPDIRRIWSE